MDLHIHAIAILLACTIFNTSCALLVQPKQNQGGNARMEEKNTSYLESLEEGFRTPPELQAIQDLINLKKFTEAHESATALIEQPSNSFSSSKQEIFLKGTAYYLRGEIIAELGEDESALDDFIQASRLGHPFAPYQVAGRLVIRNSTPEKIYAYYLMCAELAYSTCIDHIQVIYRARHEKENEHYWFLLERMNEDTEAINRFIKFYKEDLTHDDRLFFDRVMKKKSLSGGKYSSSIAGLPGRSTLASAYVDLNMRKQLRFVWLAFFDENGVETTYGMKQVYDGRREITRNNPIVDFWLLVNKRYSVDLDAISLDSEELVRNILPGDEIFVRCGRLSHYAIVWAIDHKKQEVLLLDPFDEFWQPTHNRCITIYERQQYKYERYLVRVSAPELERMLVSVFTIRDR